MTGTTASSSRLLKRWGDEAVVYDARSGDTHYLPPLTFALYETCRAHPGYTADELATGVAARLNTAQTVEFLALVDDALASLRKIGLLQSA
jgi:PqqD family protein of HPr-rel-A system